MALVNSINKPSNPGYIDFSPEEIKYIDGLLRPNAVKVTELVGAITRSVWSRELDMDDLHAFKTWTSSPAFLKVLSAQDEINTESSKIPDDVTEGLPLAFAEIVDISNQKLTAGNLFEHGFRKLLEREL